MGYHATGSGKLMFFGMLSEEKCDAIYEALSEQFTEVDWWYEQRPQSYTVFDIVRDDGWNYWSDQILDALNAAVTLAPFVGGSVEFIGDDFEQWRFLWKSGNWTLESSKIIYESDPGYSMPAFDVFGQLEESAEIKQVDADPATLLC